MLSDKRILEEMENGNIVIEPFDKRHLGTNSYDCRLGNYYYRATQGQTFMLDDHDDIAEMWGKPLQAYKHIIVAPGETILAHTIEVVGGKSGYLAKMHARSTTARWGLSVCRCAGIGDVGYISTWTMEISNHTQNVLIIPVGYRIAQMVFEYVGETESEYHGTSHSGNYGRDWSKLDMLPQALKQWDRDEIARIQQSLAEREQVL